MKKKILIILSFLLLLTGCETKDVAEEKKGIVEEKKEVKDVVEEKYTYNFFGTFDTIVTTVMYAKDQDEADKYNAYIEKRFNELHKEFNKYNNYDGINNVKTINDNAGVKPVKVSKELFNLIKLSKEYYEKYSKNTDISFGAVLNIWSDYRDLNESLNGDEDYTKEELLPSIEALKEADKYTGIEHIELNEEERTVYIDNPNTNLDVGAVAKGYAVELIANEMKEQGCDSLLISAGGNVKAVGSPNDGIRAKWGIGVQNPDVLYPKENMPNTVETLFIADKSVVTSGDYQRYFIVDDVPYNHLIDTETLFPGNYFRAVTVVCENSGLADFLSTSIFLMPFEQGKKLVESIDGVECLWINKDNSIVVTDGMKSMMLSEGATGAKDAKK